MHMRKTIRRGAVLVNRFLHIRKEWTLAGPVVTVTPVFRHEEHICRFAGNARKRKMNYAAIRQNNMRRSVPDGSRLYPWPDACGTPESHSQ